jgi:hypothetical protein
VSCRRMRTVSSRSTAARRCLRSVEGGQCAYPTVAVRLSRHLAADATGLRFSGAVDEPPARIDHGRGDPRGAARRPPGREAGWLWAALDHCHCQATITAAGLAVGRRTGGVAQPIATRTEPAAGPASAPAVSRAPSARPRRKTLSDLDRCRRKLVDSVETTVFIATCSVTRQASADSPRPSVRA